MNDNAATQRVSRSTWQTMPIMPMDLSSARLLIRKDTGTITLFAFDAGQGLSEHKAPFDAVVTILDGQAEITIGGNTSSVSRPVRC